MAAEVADDEEHTDSAADKQADVGEVIRQQIEVLSGENRTTRVLSQREFESCAASRHAALGPKGDTSLPVKLTMRS